MKPSEILERKGCLYIHDKDFITYNGIQVKKGDKALMFAQEGTKRDLMPYLNQDSIICYREDFLGFVFIIKSARSYFAYAGFTSDLYVGGMDYKFRRVELEQAFKLMKGKPEVVNQEHYDKIEAKRILNALD